MSFSSLPLDLPNKFLENFSYLTLKHMMARRVMETRMMAQPTPIKTPSTGEMISLVLREPILAWSSCVWEMVAGLVVTASRDVTSLAPLEFSACRVRLKVLSDRSPDTWKDGVLLVRLATLVPPSLSTTLSRKTWARPPSKPGRQETEKELWLSSLTEQLLTGSGGPGEDKYKQQQQQMILFTWKYSSSSRFNRIFQSTSCNSLYEDSLSVERGEWDLPAGMMWYTHGSDCLPTVLVAQHNTEP